MPFIMASLNRTKSGAYSARKGIPKDVQDEYARLYGTRWEAKLSLPPELKHQEAKARAAGWIAEIESRIAAIRAKQRGERQALTQRQATALAGEWYKWFVGQREENPGALIRSYALFLDNLTDEYIEAVLLLQRRANERMSHYQVTSKRIEREYPHWFDVPIPEGSLGRRCTGDSRSQ
jgi:hypothetical protein